MSWYRSLRLEVGFFAFYSILGFCFVCVPAEVIGVALDAELETIAVAMLMLALGFATILRIHTHEVVAEQLNRQSRTVPLEHWKEFQESMK
jgi:hypothetical protein